MDKPLSFLTIYDAPFELSDLAIIKRLSPYCEVLHYHRGKHSLAPNIYNGLRHYRVRISKPIPSFLCFGKFQIFVKHNSQVPTCRNSPARVIFKKGDRKNLKNWRPISLLNVDYKICSKVLSLRLSKVLEFIVDPDQTCSVPGRKITSNLHILRDVLDYIDRTNETGILISLDQEKAFDRVNRTFLLNLLSLSVFVHPFVFGSILYTMARICALL